MKSQKQIKEEELEKIKDSAFVYKLFREYPKETIELFERIEKLLENYEK